MRLLNFLVATAILGLTLPGNSFGAKILTVAFISSKSHKITYERLVHQLASRGHEITVLSPIVASKKVPNVNEILTFDADEVMSQDGDGSPNFFEMKESGASANPFMMVGMFSTFCEMTYDLPQVTGLLTQKFDLVMVSGIFNECAAGFVHKLNTSMILISPVSASSWLTHFTGGSSPPSFVPNIFTGYTHHMDFYQRTKNFLMEVTMTTLYHFYFMPSMSNVYRDKLQDPDLPSAFQIFSNTSLILSNGHFTLGSPKPFLPDIVEVAGMHCRPAEKLPKDLEDFIQGAGDHGFIYFSMGSAIRGDTLQDHKRKMILGAFAQMKQRVLWKWESETMPDLPSNVKLSKWLPQQDLLGHPKLRVFITHGGFGSTTESVYHGAPLVGIPMFGDQELNIQLAEQHGFAVRLDFTKLTQDLIVTTLNKVIGDKTFKQNVAKLSELFRDQPQAALDRAVFWTEYVIRHKGAVHLRSAARDLNFFQYYCLDVIGFLAGIVFVPLYLLFVVIRAICRKLCGQSKLNSKSELKKKRN